jgi:hypothetical protein
MGARPVLSFKSALASYQQALIATKSDDPSSSEAMKILKRWEDHQDVETAWTTIQEKFPPYCMPTPREFIHGVLETGKAPRQLKEVGRQTAAVEKELRKTIHGHWQSGDVANAQGKKKAVIEFHEMGNRLLGRRRLSDAPRRRFTALWRDHFREYCGQPLDSVVSVLVKAVFDFEIDPPDVHLSQRPTTRRGRKKGSK